MSVRARFLNVAGIALAILGLTLIGVRPTLAQSAPATPPGSVAPATPAPDHDSDTSTGQEITLPSRPVIAFSGSAQWDDGFKTLTDSFGKIRDGMTAAGLSPAGRPFTVFTETDDQGFRYDAMIPVATPPADASKLPSGVRATTSPAGKTMKFEHRGAYEDIDSTYEAITAYLDEKMMEAKNLFIEEYLNDITAPDDDDLQVDIYVFVK